MSKDEETTTMTVNTNPTNTIKKTIQQSKMNNLVVIRKRVEWYFSYENLLNDVGNLKSQMDGQRTVSLETILALDTVKEVASSENMIEKALEDSEVVVCEEGRVKSIWAYTKVDNEEFKCIQYPKASLNFRLVLPAPMRGYIKVRSIVHNDAIKEDVSLEVGTTDTCEKSSTPVWNKNPIEFTYYCGVDNHQRLVFDIYDGDYLAINEGYLLESKEIMAVDLFRPNTIFPISIERDKYWGKFIVEVSYDAKYIYVYILLYRMFSVTMVLIFVFLPHLTCN